MDLQDFFKNKDVIRNGLTLAKASPKWLGYGVAKTVGRMIAQRKPNVYWQMRDNISHIPGTNDEPGKLDKITRRAFINAGRFYYDYYHVIGMPPNHICEVIHIPDIVFEHIDRIQSSGRGVQLAGIHLSNFDLGSISLTAHGLKIQALSAANPNEGYEYQNELRKKYGFIATPINPSTLKDAIKKLRNGGIIAGGLDWPQPEETHLTKVFGKPAYVPLGTARLALLSDAVTIILAFYYDKYKGYQLHVADPIEVIRTGNKQEDIRVNTAAYMRVFESIVSQHPEQWMMFHKFWADTPAMGVES
ncbi:MAG: hypothetical protein P8046_04605 [Anaerolineales bacterium]